MFPILSGVLARRRACLSALAFVLALPGYATEPATDSWVADFRRYAAQPNLQNDSPYNTEKEPAYHFAELLRGLPGPAQWPALRQAFADAAAKAPEGVERQQLRAGSWLFAYLAGDRAAVLAELPAPAAGEQSTNEPSAQALANLRATLSGRAERDASPAQELEYFEQQLLALEPVNVEDVKRLLGGEENFARLHRLIDASKAMQGKMQVIYEEYEKTKDEAAARTKAEQLQKDFETQNAADEKALEPFQRDPLLRRYLMTLYQGEDSRFKDYVGSITVPDLVTLAGAERAEALLHRAVRLRVTLGVNERTGDATRKLARRLELAAIDEVKAPSWSLTLDTVAADLFAALYKRFPQPGPNDYDFKRATGYYLAALIEQGRVPEAVAFATEVRTGNQLELPYDVMNALEEGGRAPELWDFLHQWLAKHPAANEWDRFNRLSAQLGRLDRLRAFIAELAANGSFNGLDRLEAQRMQADAEFAADDLAAGAKRLRTLLEPVGATKEETKIQFEIVIKLLRLAGLQDDKAGFAAVQQSGEAILGQSWLGEGSEGFDRAADLVTVLNTFGHFTDGIRISRAALDRIPALIEQAKKKAAEEMKGEKMDAETMALMERVELPDYVLRKLLAEQLRALIELKQWPEAAKLVSASPWWGVKDVNELLSEDVPSDRKPLAHYLALVARHEKREAVARKLLEAELVTQPGADSVYQDYIDLVGRDALPLFAKLAASDRYQERPLIWRGKLETDAKQWDAAIATLQEAISIDPSDGEEGRGDRMRVYANLSRALEGKGDKTKADFFAGVVKAIRMSETADRWFEIGAYSHAISLYRQALGFFQDAYCIQSRLAVRLAAEGKIDEAAEHYRRAFELMPDSFGRVESHCFGCEHVFAGKKSQGVAEQVFTQMLQARPDKPQLHYLMGYLRQEQEQPKEAAEHYRKAVQLDPLYLNAWDRLAGLESTLKFTPAERDELYLKLMELDPLRRHASPSLEHVSDLTKLWKAMETAQHVAAGLPSTKAPIWELKASAAQVGTKPDVSSQWSDRDAYFGDVIGRHDFVRALQGYLASLTMPPETLKLDN